MKTLRAQLGFARLISVTLYLLASAQAAIQNGYWLITISGKKTFVVCVLALVICPATASAQTYKDIYDFDGTTHGCCPRYPALLAQGRDGALYGTTPQGGTSGGGIAFKITTDGTLTVLYNFDILHGYAPNGGLILGSDGNLYGTSQNGGAHNLGNIFKITPAGAFTVLYDFAGSADGGNPIAPLVLGSDGNFYGTSAPGAAFKLSSKGVFKLISKTPYMTYGPLVQGSDGAFYGTTQIGGTSNLGTVFKIVKTTVTTLYSFDTTHGSYPFGGLVQGNDGNFYGTTTRGGSFDGGVVYQITPSGSLTVLYNFDSSDSGNGNQPYAGLVAATDGNLYGSTAFGGNGSSGTLFKITTGGALTVLANFDEVHGARAFPTAVQYTNGEIFGLTTTGGAFGEGVAYSIDNSMPPFVLLTATMGTVGKSVGILGNGLTGTSSVKFNGASANFNVVSDTYITAKVPSGETGTITVTTPSGTLLSSKPYRVTPKITAFTPASGAVGSSVVISGSGFIQATSITLGGVKVTSFTVNSDKQVTFTVPAGARTGKVVITTPGGAATSAATFTVT